MQLLEGSFKLIYKDKRDADRYRLKNEEGLMMEAERSRLSKLDLLKYGPQGTLYGTFAALTAIVIIALAQMITGRNVVEGWAFTVMVIVIAVAVVFYGAFIFERSLSLEGKHKGFTFRARSGDAQNRTTG